MKHRRLSNVDSVKQMSVIAVESCCGEGTEAYPYKTIVEYFLPDGTRLARRDSFDNVSDIHEWTKEEHK